MNFQRQRAEKENAGKNDDAKLFHRKWPKSSSSQFDLHEMTLEKKMINHKQICTNTVEK